MAKKKRRTDNTLLTSIYSPEYQYLAQQNSPVNSNIFYEGGGLDGNGNGGTDWTSLVQQDNSINVSNLGQNNPYLGMNQQNVGTPTGNYIDGLQTEFHRVNPMKYLTMSEPERMRQNELRQEARIERKEARQAENAADNGGNGGSGVNWGGVIGAAATNVANSLTDPNATTAQKVANALGAPEMAKIWSADWDKANTQIKGIQENIASFNNKNYIQDSNDIQGAGAGLKLNNKPLTLLNTNPQKNLTWKDFRGNMFLKGAKATLQGAASGSVGGPWGALGGAVTGLFGSLFGGIGAKKRAKRAKAKYDRMLADYNAYGLQQNAKAIMERDLSNQNLLSNGLKQQNISEMANFRAYGGNLYPDGGTIEPYYPESSDPDAVHWLSDWYKQRPNQVQNTFGNNHNLSFVQINPNMNETYYGEANVPKERKVDYNLLTYPTEEEYNKNLYKNLIDRAAASSNVLSENMWKGAGGTYSVDGTHFVQNPNFDPHYNDWLMQQWKNGNYVEPEIDKNTPESMINGDNYKNTIMYNWNAMNDKNDGMSTRIHERTHSMVTDPLLNDIDNGLRDSINNKLQLNKNIENDTYWDDPNEIYSRMNEFRYKSGLKGSDKVTKEFLNENRKLLEDKGLDRYTDESLLKLFNEIADNNNMSNYSNIAAMGGQFDINLSPNMMNLWNNKQQIDQQKVMNQQMNFGLGNSFNQKLNTFDYGGAMNGMDLPTDMQYYENGGTHEENPNGGIQVGQDQQGNPNLVEEGEFRYGDYVFSDRIPVDYSILSDFNIGKSKGNRNTKNNPTYAELAKKTADKYKDLNDEISKNSLNKQLDRLQQSQEAQKFKEQQDQQYADYTSALKNPTQGNPMYGSMKYNGMGNANQGVNAGVDEGMGNPMDNSDLSNVNRSGNAMMAAYGGNLFPYGGDTRRDEYGNIVIGYDKNNIFANNPFKSVATPQNLGDASAYGYNTATKDDYNKLNIDVPFNPSGMVGNVRYSQLPFNRPELAGVNTNFNPITNPTAAQKQQLLVNNGYNLGSTGFYGNGVDNVWGKKSQEAWDDFTGNKYGSTQSNQNQTSPNGSKYSYQSGSYKVKEQVVDKEGLNDYNEKNKPSDGVGVASEQNGNNFMNPQRPQESRGDVDLKNAEVVGSTPYNRPMYNDSGIWANLGKGIAPNLMNWANRANWEFDPDWKPEAKLEALGKTAYRERIADHLGDYVAPNLMDVERLNNAARAQTAANARGITNIGGGNRGFAAAQMAANDYNGQMGIGNNYVTTNQYNADQLFKSADFNRATNQFNATVNNEAWRDNLNSWLQGKNMEINALAQANQARNQKAEYKDRVDREAALNRSSDLGAMTDNMINTVVDEARFNRDLNIANQDRSNRYWYDKKKGSMYDAANTDYEDSVRNLMNGKYVDSEAWNQLNALNKEYGFDSRATKDKLKAAENIINQSQERYNNKQDLLNKEKAETLKNDYDYALNNYNVMRNDPEFMKYMGKALGQGKLGTFSDLYGSDISEQELRRYMNDVNRLYSYYNSYGNRPSENAAKAYGGKLKTRKRDYSLSLS